MSNKTITVLPVLVAVITLGVLIVDNRCSAQQRDDQIGATNRTTGAVKETTGAVERVEEAVETTTGAVKRVEDAVEESTEEIIDELAKKETLARGALVYPYASKIDVYRVDGHDGNTALLRHIPNEEMFKVAGCDWNSVQDISANLSGYDYRIIEPYQGGDFHC